MTNKALLTPSKPKEGNQRSNLLLCSLVQVTNIKNIKVFLGGFFFFVFVFLTVVFLFTFSFGNERDYQLSTKQN